MATKTKEAGAKTESTSVTHATGTSEQRSSTGGNGNKPVKKLKAKGISVSIFANESESAGKPYYKTTVQKFYKDGEEWKMTQSLGRDDLPIVRLLLDRAWQWIIDQEASQSKEEA